MLHNLVLVLKNNAYWIYQTSFYEKYQSHQFQDEMIDPKFFDNTATGIIFA